MHFRMLRYVKKPWQRVKHLIIVTLTFLIYYYNDIFLVEMISNTKSTWKNQNCLEENKKLGKYQTRYFIRTFILSFLHGVFIMLYINLRAS